MKKFMLHFTVIGLIVFTFCGCRLYGPSDKEVFEAMEAVVRGFQSSMDQQTLEIDNAYANAADAVFRNEDESVVTNMTVLMNEGVFHIYGRCIFSDYQDESSDYLMNGELIYNVKFQGGFHANEGFGEMGCVVELSGGKIETLEFSFFINEDGEMEEFLITANEMDIEIQKEDNLYNLFKTWSQTMPG